MTENQTTSVSNSEQARSAFRFSLAMAISMTLISVLLVIIGGPPKGPMDLTTFAIVSSLVAILSTWLSRRGQHVLGILLLIGSLLLICILTSFIFSGFGPVLAVIALLIAFGAGSTALPRKYANLVNTVSVVLALFFMVLDIFEPFPREPNEMPALTWGVAGALALVFGLGIIRSFNRYNFRTKLIIGFTTVTLISLGVLTIFSFNTTTNILTDNLGRELSTISNDRASRIASLLQEQISILTVLSFSESVQDAMGAANVAYEDDQGDRLDILAAIEELDRQWRAADAADNDNDPLVNSRMYNLTALDLRTFQDAFPDNAEVFFTDIFGALVSTTNRTSDYYQGDEEWWLAAYNNGAGAIYIGDPEFDESVGQFSIVIAIPVIDNITGGVSGILRTTFNLGAISTILGESFGETGAVDLLIPGEDPFFIHSEGIEPVEANTYEQLISIGDQDFVEMLFKQVDSLVSQASVSSLDKIPAIDELGWSVVVHQHSEEVLAPVQVQTRSALGLVIVVVGIAVAAAAGMAQILVNPITRLTNTAQEIAGGDLSLQAEVTTEDEIGTLAATFNEMTARLRRILEGLEDRIAARTQDLQLAAEVGRRLSLVQETEVMLAEAVEIIRQRFDLYYTQIYLTDPTGRSLVLQAGTGDVGRTLLNRGHRLPIDMGSLNGIAVTEQRAIIVEDTETHPLHRDNPLLPDTRSEMVVPLLVANRVVGVLDMQSSQPGALNPENLAAFEALAGSLAIAISNAGLFEEAEQARIIVEEQARRQTREGWRDFLDAIERSERLAYTYDRENITPLPEPLPEASDETTLVTPIRIAGASVGQLQFLRDEAWTEDDFAISNLVAQQVAQQVENLRLLAQAEQYQAEAEEALRRLTREGWEEFQDQLDISPGFVYQDHEVRTLTESDESFDKALNYDIKVHDETIGILSIAGSEALSEDDADLVAAINEQLSAHLNNLRLSTQTEQALAQTEMLYNIGSQLNLATNEDEILKAVNHLAENIGCSQSSLMYIDPDSSGEPAWLTIVAAWATGNSPAAPVGLRLPVAQYPITSTILTNTDKPVFIPDVANADNIDEMLRGRWLEVGFRGMVMVPLGQAGQWLGLITFGWSEPYAFSDQEKENFEGLISLVTPVVQSHRLFDQVQKRAQREQMLREITTEVYAAPDAESILKKAAEEIFQRLGLEAFVYLEKSDEFLNASPEATASKVSEADQ